MTPANRFEWEKSVRSARLDSYAKLVALTLATYANRDGRNARPGVERLMADTGLSDSTVRRRLTTLQRAGYLYRCAKGSANGRRALTDVWQLVQPDTEHRSRETGDNTVGDGRVAREHRSERSGTPVTALTEYHEVIHHPAPLEPPADAVADGSDEEQERLEGQRLERELDELSRQCRGHGLRDEELKLLNGMAGRGAPFPAIWNAIVKRIGPPMAVAS